MLGHRHATVTLLVEAGGQHAAVYMEYANVVRDDLAKIGLHVVIRRVPSVYTAHGGDMRIYGWLFDYWDPADLFSGMLFTTDTNNNPYGFHSARWQRAYDRASQLTGRARLAAFSAVARGVHTLLPWVVLDEPGDPAFFSARLGCIHFPPAFQGVDLAALCPRASNRGT